MPLLLQTSIFFSQHYAIPKGRLLSKGALAIPAMLLFLFANRSLLCLYGHFPFYSYCFSIILNPFPVPTPQKPAGSLQTWEKKQSTSFCLPIPIQGVVGEPEGGHKQPAASGNLTAHSGPLNTLRLTSDKSLPFPSFRAKRSRALKSPTHNFTTISRIYVTRYTASLKSDHLMSPTALSLLPQTSNFLSQIYLERLSISCRYIIKKSFSIMFT